MSRKQKRFVRGRFEVADGKKIGQRMCRKDRLGNIKYFEVVPIKKPIHPAAVPLTVRRKCERAIFKREMDIASLKRRTKSKRKTSKRKSSSKRKRKTSKRKTKRRSSSRKRKTSKRKRKTSKRKTSKRRSSSRKRKTSKRKTKRKRKTKK